MNIRYLLLSVLAVLMGGLLLFLPEQDYTNQLSPEEFHRATLDDSHIITADELAHRMIEKDPSLLLVDVRTAGEYEEWSLPGALNIPLDSILSETSFSLIDQDVQDIVFYSTGTVYASQAWSLCKREGVQNLYILRGGINGWVETVLKPQAPGKVASQKELDLYQFRLAAAQFFSGRSVSVQPEAAGVSPAAVSGKKKKSVQGGC